MTEIVIYLGLPWYLPWLAMLAGYGAPKLARWVVWG